MTAACALRTRPAALSLAIAGACFLAYPAIRPYTDEASLVGAGAFAFPACLLRYRTAGRTTPNRAKPAWSS